MECFDRPNVGVAGLPLALHLPLRLLVMRALVWTRGGVARSSPTQATTASSPRVARCVRAWSTSRRRQAGPTHAERVESGAVDLAGYRS